MKQTCSWCGRDRKAKHFPAGSADCKDCVNQKSNQRLAGTGPNPNAGGGFGAPFIGMSSPTGAHIPAGLAGFLNSPGNTSGPLPFAPPKPPKKKKEREVVHAEDVPEHECPGDDTCDVCVPVELNPWKRKPVHSVEEVSTFVDSTAVDKIELQLKYGMNDEGKPLKDSERADLEAQYNRLLFGRSAAPSADEEAEALASILGSQS